MDFKKMMAEMKAEAAKEKGGDSGGSSSGPKFSSYQAPIERLGLAIRGCEAAEPALWVARAGNTNGSVPSHNSYTSGSCYVLTANVYNADWKSRLVNSIRTCKTGGSSALLILKSNFGTGIADYENHLPKRAVSDIAVLVSWMSITTMSAEDAADLVCAVILNPALTG